MSKRQIIILIFIAILILFNSLIFVLASLWFPSHGGFTRYVFFIRPDNESNSSGYFIIIDELAPESEEFPIEWVLHGRGTLNISDTSQSAKYTTQSYLSSDMISLNLTFLGQIQQITTHTGIFYPAYRYDGSDNTPTYLKAKYSGNTNPLMGAVLYPTNESDSSTMVPQISGVTPSEMGQIGNSDLIYYQKTRKSQVFSSPNSITSDARILFIHKNTTGSLDYFFIQDVTQLSFTSIDYFQSSVPVSNLLITYSNFSAEITGHINCEEALTGSISLYVPFQASSVIIDGKNISFNQIGDLISFNLKPGAFVIKKGTIPSEITHHEGNPLLSSTVYDSFPLKAKWDYNISQIEAMTHPYVLFDSAELDILRQKINQSLTPWKPWYDTYTAGVEALKDINISTLAWDARWVPMRKLALKFAIDGGVEYFDKLKELLLDLPNVQDLYDQDLKRADAVRAYSIAFDIVYNNLSAIEQSIITAYLYAHAVPLTEMERFSDNNHRSRDAGGLGLAGFVLKDKYFIDLSTETILTYLYEKVRPDGGSYEGQSYQSSAFFETMEFWHALKRLGGYNIFNNTKYLTMLDFMVQCLSPFGLPPLYEDAVADGRTNIILLMSAPHIENSKDAQEYQWLWETRDNNTDLVGLDGYTYLLGYGVHLQMLTCYNPPTKLNASQPSYSSMVFKDSGMAFLRSGYSQNAIYLSFSCKNFMQSHPHYDENSFELWAYGAWLIHNPGYPGFGESGHDYAIETEGSNTLLINQGGQLFEKASGFKSAILSPYFEMIQADAKHAYNSPGSLKESLNGYLLSIYTFMLLGISAFLYIHAKYSTQKTLRANSNPSNEDSYQSSQIPFKTFLRDAFLSPISLQQNLLIENQKSNVKRFKLLIASIITVVSLLFLFYLVQIVNYYIEEMILTAQLFFNLMDIYLLELALFVIVGVVSFLSIYGFIRLFGHFTYFFCSDCNPQFPEVRRQLKASYTASLAWQLPVIGFSSLIISLTILQGLGSFFHTLFQSVGGTNEVVNYLFGILRQTNLAILSIILLGIPFFIISIYSTGYGVSLISKSSISPRNGAKITTASVFLILSILTIIFMFMFLILCQLISGQGIEALTGG